jgi:hypothetical protein
LSDVLIYQNSLAIAAELQQEPKALIDLISSEQIDTHKLKNVHKFKNYGNKTF